MQSPSANIKPAAIIKRTVPLDNVQEMPRLVFPRLMRARTDKVGMEGYELKAGRLYTILYPHRDGGLNYYVAKMGRDEVAWKQDNFDEEFVQ